MRLGVPARGCWVETCIGFSREGLFHTRLEALVESLAAACRMEQHPAMLNLYHLAAVAADDLATGP